MSFYNALNSPKKQMSRQ